MSNQLRAKLLVRAALARALFDAPKEVASNLGISVYDRQRLAGPPGEPLLAQMIVAEMAREGWVLGHARGCPASDSPITKRMWLEENVAFGIDRCGVDRRAELCADIDPQGRALAGDARALLVNNVVSSFELMKVHLVKRLCPQCGR